jgi:hypothetical protein
MQTLKFLTRRIIESTIDTTYKLFLQEKAVEATKQKDKRGKNLSPRNRKACHSIGTALMKSVAEIGTQSAMKSNRKTLNEFASHIPPKTPKRNRSR